MNKTAGFILKALGVGFLLAAVVLIKEIDVESLERRRKALTDASHDAQIALRMHGRTSQQFIEATKKVAEHKKQFKQLFK